MSEGQGSLLQKFICPIAGETTGNEMRGGGAPRIALNQRSEDKEEKSCVKAEIACQM